MTTSPAERQPVTTTLLMSEIFAATVLCMVLIVLLRPLLIRYALARPNARSSHKIPTPQGGGIAVVGATLVVAVVAALLPPSSHPVGSDLGLLAAATVLLAALGAVDDVHPLTVSLRLGIQFVAVALLTATLPADVPILGILPDAVERALVVVAVMWFVNLVNFMDGLDWMTVAEVVPVSAALIIFGALGALPWVGVTVAAALLGAMIGFGPFNRPIARLFLGDVGSLPIGLILAFLLIRLAAAGHLAAAVLLPGYYLADATLTLARRLMEGERVWEAHRSHFYQRATDGGFTVMEVVSRVFAVNVGLALLGLATVIWPTRGLVAAALCGGGILVGGLLVVFARGRA
jgi:UDP-N-acetylmuramyl pentapeptide phosphotransferase/UDP-N-acetylglucosamine-1-phosphate transferase